MNMENLVISDKEPASTEYKELLYISDNTEASHTITIRGNYPIKHSWKKKMSSKQKIWPSIKTDAQSYWLLKE